MSETADGTGDEQSAERGIKTYIVWFLAGMLIFAGLGALVSGSGPVGLLRGLVAAALMTTAGLIAIAYTTRTEHLEPLRTQLPASTIAVVGIILVFAVAGAAIGPQTDDVDDADPGVGNGDDGATDTPDDPDDDDGAADDGSGDDGAADDDGSGDDGAAGDDGTDDDGESTPAPTPTASPQPSLDSYQYSGSGQQVTDSMSLEGGLVTFEMDHDGESNFQVELIDEGTGDTEEYLANEIGTWEAAQPHYIPEGDYVLEVNADGNWNVNVEQPRPSPSDAEDPPASLSDEYPNYIGPIQFDGLHRISGEYRGDSNFAVWVLDEDGREQDLIFNEIGEFEGEQTYSGNHVGYIRIESTGEWDVEVE